MRKKITITLIIVIGIGLTLGLVLGDGFYTRVKEVPKEHSEIENVVLKAIKLQYRGGQIDELKKVFTSDYIEKMNSNNTGFHKNPIIYIIDKNFMKTCEIINENEAEVTVEVEDIEGRYIQVITLVKGTDGNYLISEIQYDI